MFPWGASRSEVLEPPCPGSGHYQQIHVVEEVAWRTWGSTTFELRGFRAVAVSEFHVLDAQLEKAATLRTWVR